MLLSVNTKIKNKPETYPAEANNKFENVEFSREEVARTINLGNTIAAQYIDGTRKADNFKCIGYAGLDFDGTWSLEEAQHDEFIKLKGALIYTTASHQKEGKGDHFRVLFELESPINDRFQYEMLMKALLTKFPKADQICGDALRVFYGSKGSKPILLDGLLDSETISELIESSIKANNDMSKGDNSDQVTKLKVSFDDVREMLKFIPSDVDYRIWLAVCFAIASEYGEAGKELIEEWSPDIKDKGKHLNNIFNRSDGRIKIGTVIYYASKYGYTIPSHLVNDRTEGQVALQDVFDNGEAFISLGDDIYDYEEEFYNKKPEGYLKHKITKYFNIYPTDKAGKTKYAKASSVESAYKFVVNMIYRDVNDANPPGINLNNGYLSITYDNGSPVFTLLPHSSDRIFTYKADFNYDPDCDSSIFQEIMDAMLSREQQEILFRVLGASLDLQEVRKRQGRLRLLLLLGDGNNGKDTLKSWLILLYGGHGVTMVELQKFKSTQNRFGLHPLLTSRVNWASENDIISIDQCSALKNFASGDEMTMEMKYKDPITFKPKAIGLFNLNDLPKMQSTQEADLSRYYVIKFDTIFKSNPDPNKPWEKKADPRLKEDEDFIKKNILPAFLNRIIQGFKDILESGIDYDANEELMRTIRESNNHFLEFIREVGMEECHPDEGVQPKKLYQRVYLRWCHNEGLIFEDDNGRITYYDPHPKYDRIVRGFKQITPKINKLFPKLQMKRIPEGNVLGVKITNPEYLKLLKDIY